jgi:polyhydroxyalkanoate synthesis regulator phasin
MNAKVNEIQQLIRELKENQEGDNKVELVKKLEELLKAVEGKHQHQIESLETHISQLKNEVGRLSRL